LLLVRSLFSRSEIGFWLSMANAMQSKNGRDFTALRYESPIRLHATHMGIQRPFTYPTTMFAMRS